jgi:hypothetical protein
MGTPSEAYSTPESEIRRIVESAAHLLPAQGPIRIFIHHNTLHAFEDMPFEEAVVRAGERFGCKPFLEEEDYRRELARGRIRTDDLRAILIEELGTRDSERVVGETSRLDLRLALLHNGLHEPEEDELDWYLTESEKAVDESLWRACLEYVSPLGVRSLPVRPRVRHRDALLAATTEDTDDLVHPFLIRFCAAFCDQGVAYWPMPGRERGLFRCFVDLYSGQAMPDAWLAGLCAKLAHRDDPAQSIARSLEALSVSREDWRDYIDETVLALRGWPGMLRQMEERPDRVLVPSPPGSLLDYLAVRLVLEELAVEYVARRAGLSPNTGSPASTQSARVRAYTLYQVVRFMGWSLDSLLRSPAPAVMHEIESFPAIERRRVLHLGYERRHRHETLAALAVHCGDEPTGPKFQTVHCIDEREESFRRHLEEIEPTCETVGTAGFFGVAMYYQGALDAHPVPLCPVVIRPRHTVREMPVEEISRQARRFLGRLAHAAHVGSRTGVRGSILSGLFGTLAAIPLVARVMFPRHAEKVRTGFSRELPRTRLEWDYSLDEMTEIVRRLLEETGLAGRLSRLVIVIGHGSSSLNNPHESAHDCGACGGGRGGPNARVFALMANDPRVRERLAIPVETVFVAAYHDSCDDDVEYFDLDRVPATHTDELHAAQSALDEARARNAHERCRRFDNAPLGLTPAQALRHVEDRSQDLAQVRPEYGHATNAVAIVGRRRITRGLYMDRRAFLVSYDPTRDADGTILTNVLQAVGPVCAGINLEYYFSFVDPVGYGCSTKLPHNITGLLGVMDGPASDLRTGLPWQMVEIHEPVRLLVVIEAPLDRVELAILRLPGVSRLARNRWIQVAALDPESKAIHVLGSRGFERHAVQGGDLPEVRSSVDWYAKARDHLAYARIRP